MEEEVGDLVWSVGGVGFGGEERREGRKKAREGMREASEDLGGFTWHQAATSLRRLLGRTTQVRPADLLEGLKQRS
jgi:hypothetical protein